jgi:hypothetical protein
MMKRRELVKVITSILVVASVITLNPIGVSAEWKQNNRGWWYTEGDSWATGWRKINDNWYYFDDNGYMADNTVVEGYYVDKNGVYIDDSKFNITITKAQDIVRGYLTKSGKYVPKFIETETLGGNSWGVHCYDVVPFYGSITRTSTVGWYYIDRDTGEITSKFPA